MKRFCIVPALLALCLLTLPAQPQATVDSVFTTSIFDLTTPELGLPGQAMQVRQAGQIVGTVIETKDPSLTKTATRDNGGVPLGRDDALHVLAHRVTVIDTQTLRRDCTLVNGVWTAQPQPAGQKGILADLSSHCWSYQPQGGLYPLPGSYLHGEYQEAPVVRNGAVVGSAYYTLQLAVLKDNHVDHPAAEMWYYSASPAGHKMRWGYGQGIFSSGQSDPGEGAIRFARGEFDTISANTVNARVYNTQRVTTTSARRGAFEVVQLGVWGEGNIPTPAYLGWGAMFWRVRADGGWQLCGSDGRSILAGPVFVRE